MTLTGVLRNCPEYYALKPAQEILAIGAEPFRTRQSIDIQSCNLCRWCAGVLGFVRGGNTDAIYLSGVVFARLG
jgi:hypothetical protein